MKLSKKRELMNKVYPKKNRRCKRSKMKGVSNSTYKGYIKIVRG